MFQSCLVLSTVKRIKNQISLWFLSDFVAGCRVTATHLIWDEVQAGSTPVIPIILTLVGGYLMIRITEFADSRKEVERSLVTHLDVIIEHLLCLILDPL